MASKKRASAVQAAGKKPPPADSHRQRATVSEVRSGTGAHGLPTTWVSLDFGHFTQSFGGYNLTGHQAAWDRALCRLFAVGDLNDIVGKTCWALRSFSAWNEPIEGLESDDGKRFVATDFWREHLSAPVPSCLEKRRAAIQSTLAALNRRIADETRRLNELEADYIEWATKADYIARVKGGRGMSEQTKPGDPARVDEDVLTAIRSGWQERGDIVRFFQIRSIPWSRADVESSLRRLKRAGRIVHKDCGWEVSR